MTDLDIISEFGILDELIQVIYQGANKFIVLSNVADDGWSVYLSLTHSEGRWWSGKWTEKDVLEFIGHKTSAKHIEQFAENLVESITKGELYIANWSPIKDAEINLTVGSTSKKPVQIPLKEMEPIEAAKYATKTFALIASYAQDRKCRLYPSPYEVIASSSSVAPVSTSKVVNAYSEERPAASPLAQVKKPESEASGSNTKDSAAEAEIKKLKAELAREKRKATHDDPVVEEYPLLKSKAKTHTPAKRQVKGASLANPNKKARRYQALEFEDD